MTPETVVPFGPQHPVLPEPIQLKLTLEDENVKQVLPALGYVHRGIEKAGELNDFTQNVYLVERVCGICSSVHALAYCISLEKIMAIEVPPRAQMLRVVWLELHRIHSHLLWLGLFAESFGFESLFMQLWRIRESIMDILEKTAGNRVIISVCTIGGVRRDISPQLITDIKATLDICMKQFNQVVPTLMDDPSVKKRTVGKGVITKEMALELGAVGPVLRASGVAQDMRQTGYAGYSQLDFQPITDEGCDSHARGVVRVKETLQAADLIRQALDKLEDGEIQGKVKGFPNGRALVRVEAPRGEVLYMVEGNGTKKLERMRIRVPTMANIPPLLAVLPGAEFADVPVLTLSIDPCISCTER